MILEHILFPKVKTLLRYINILHFYNLSSALQLPYNYNVYFIKAGFQHADFSASI